MKVKQLLKIFLYGEHSETLISKMLDNLDCYLYNELIQSLPEAEKEEINKELDSEAVGQRAILLSQQLAKNEYFDKKDSRILLLAALKNFKNGFISAAQLASLHLLDSAIHTFYINPVVYTWHSYVQDNKITNTRDIFTYSSNINPSLEQAPIFYAGYNAIGNRNIPNNELPKEFERFQIPLLKRFFNFTAFEWNTFCKEIKTAPLSEQSFHFLIAPEIGCYSALIYKIQQVLNCMRPLDWVQNSIEGHIINKIMLVPSFSMFQAAIIAKAQTLGRKPVELLPTYGYINLNRYADLKAAGKIPLTMYFPEKSSSQCYQLKSGLFRTTVDSWGYESAFAGALHDVYHAMREMSMSENVARARFRLASIAKKHIYP